MHNNSESENLLVNSLESLKESLCLGHNKIGVFM